MTSKNIWAPLEPIGWWQFQGLDLTLFVRRDHSDTDSSISVDDRSGRVTVDMVPTATVTSRQALTALAPGATNQH